MSSYTEITTADGRALEVLTAGDQGGFPWVYHGGSPSAAVLFEPLDAAAREAGLHLVTYSRPGCGGSSPRLPEQGAPRFVDDVADTVAVLDGLGLDDFVTLGWSGGGPRALACAALLPGRCRAATSLAGVAPLLGMGPDWYLGMAPENVAEYSAAVAGASWYEAYLETEFLPVLTATADDITAALGDLLSDVDRAALDQPYAAWLAEMFARSGAQGVVGVRDDGLAAVADWGFDLASITTPTAIWQGDQDAMVPLAHGRWLAENVPGTTAHLLEGLGHLIDRPHLAQALAELKALGGVG